MMMLNLSHSLDNEREIKCASNAPVKHHLSLKRGKMCHARVRSVKEWKLQLGT